MNELEITPIILLVLLGIMVTILLVYFVVLIAMVTKTVIPLPDPRFIGSTAFLKGLNGAYKDAVIPIPIEGIVIGSHASVANIILTDNSGSPSQVRVVFPEGRYDSIYVEEMSAIARTYYMEGEQWLLLKEKKAFTPSQQAKIRIGANQDIFEIIFRL